MSAGGAVEPIALALKAALLAGGAAEPMVMTKAAMGVELMGLKNSEVAEVKVLKKRMLCRTACETWAGGSAAFSLWEVV